MRSEQTVITSARIRCASRKTVATLSFFLLLGGILASGQAPMPSMPSQQGMADSATQDRQMADQIAELRRQVARLQAASQHSGSGNKTNARSNMKMPAPPKDMSMMGEIGMAPKGGMPMNEDGGEMGGMPAGGNGSASMLA